MVLQSCLHLYNTSSINITEFSIWNINNFETVTIATTCKFRFLDNSVFAIINHLSNQHKRTNLDKIYNEPIKTIVLENTSKENIYNRTNEPIIQVKIVNKPCRNDDSHRVNGSTDDFNIEQLEYSNFLTSNLSFARPHIKQ